MVIQNKVDVGYGNFDLLCMKINSGQHSFWVIFYVWGRQ